MYVPPHFAETSLPVLHDAIRKYGFATLVTTIEDGLIATHLPLLLDPDRGPYGTLIGHFARANPQTQPPRGEALAIFQGPEGYITPSYYAAKREHGKVVPTWNYIAVHAYGALRFIEDKDAVLAIVTRLTEHREAPRAAPWAVSDAPADFVAGMLNGIVGFEIEIARIQGKWKMSQNRPDADRAGTEAGLAADGRPDMAEAVRTSGAPFASGEKP